MNYVSCKIDKIYKLIAGYFILTHCAAFSQLVWHANWIYIELVQEMAKWLNVSVGEREWKRHKDNKTVCASPFVCLTNKHSKCAKIYMIFWPDKNSKMWPSAVYSKYI